MVSNVPPAPPPRWVPGDGQINWADFNIRLARDTQYWAVPAERDYTGIRPAEVRGTSELERRVEHLERILNDPAALYRMMVEGMDRVADSNVGGPE